MLASIIATPLPGEKQRTADPQRRDILLFELSQTWIRELMPGSRRSTPPQKAFGKAPHANKSAWARARNGDRTNPIYRLCVLLHDCKLAGVNRTKALQLLTVLRSVVDDLWPAAKADDLPTAMLKEQEAENGGNLAQIRCGQDMTVEHLRELCKSYEIEIAAERVVLAAAYKTIERMAG